MAGRGKPQARASSRSAARLATVQALYQMDMTGIDLNEVIAEFEAYRLGKEIEDCQYCDAEAAFFRDLVEGVVRAGDDLRWPLGIKPGAREALQKGLWDPIGQLLEGKEQIRTVAAALPYMRA